MPLQATSGAASQDGFGGNGVPVIPNYIEEVFNTYLYTGTGATLTITNNIDMTKGYLLWFKTRSTTKDHKVYDSARGVDKTLVPNTTASQVTQTFPISVSTTGFTIPDEYDINTLNDTLVAWTFRKQPKFFDVVTYTGNGASSMAVPHSLDAVPGFLIVKKTSATGVWYCQHRQDWQNYYRLNAIDAASSYPDLWGNTQPTSTNFYVGVDANSNGATYVAYLFAHNAGGFGLTGTDNVVSCGSFTLTGGTDIIDLGYEPQWLLTKRVNAASNWQLTDNMRGMTVSNSAAYLYPNNSNAETSGGFGLKPTATGISITAGSTGSPGDTFIYIAIRRGPMKVPTSGTSVFSPISITPSSGTVSTTNFPVDFMITTEKTTGGTSRIDHDKLRGVGTVGAGNARLLVTNDTNAESAGSSVTYNWWNTGFTWGAGFAGEAMVAWNFKRAPSFFDEVCYAGQNSAPLTNSHNLGVTPELAIIKNRTTATDWLVQTQITGLGNYLNLNTVNALSSAAYFITAWTSTTFTLSNGITATNTLGSNYVAYLFATCAGVSKVGSYTGNGSTQTIDCGFTGGARFVLIKRTDGSGGWYVYDTARGMTVLTDPYLFLNSTAAESATLGSVTTVSTGFALNAAILAAINTNGGTYIFLAIA